MSTETIHTALQAACRKAHTFSTQEGQIVRSGSGFGEAQSDTEILADEILGDVVTDILSQDGESVIWVEGRDPVTYGGKQIPKTLFTVDPLDGSLNFRRRSGSQGFPYATVIAEFTRRNPTFRDCTVAGVIDLRNHDEWLARKGKGCTLNGDPCTTSTMRKVDKTLGTYIIADLYYPETRKLVAKAFTDFRGWIRAPGAAGYELALVASGSVDAFISTDQKCDVLGAAYLIITETGGVVMDFGGNDLGEFPYRFTDQIPVIAAATEELANEILERIQNVR